MEETVMLERGETIKKRVESLLEQFPEARNDKRELLRIYYQRYTGVRLTGKLLNSLYFSPSPETIYRREREIKEARPELAGTEETVRKRGNLAFLYKENYRQMTIRE